MSSRATRRPSPVLILLPTVAESSLARRVCFSTALCTIYHIQYLTGVHSIDRNAYVWEQTPTGWKPTLVLLRINRAATFVRWSPSEQKFAVGSGARVIAVCYFEEENDWWISKHIKKPIRSTITTLAWHPNSVLLAAGSTDSHARVFSSFIKGIDTRPEPSAWGERLPFNTICGEYLNDTAGWIQGVAFSPSGNALAFTGHDSSVTVVYPSAPEQPPRAMLNIATRLLPLNSLIWNGETEIIAAGHVSCLFMAIRRLVLIVSRTVSPSVSTAMRMDGNLPALWRKRLVKPGVPARSLL